MNTLTFQGRTIQITDGELIALGIAAATDEAQAACDRSSDEDGAALRSVNPKMDFLFDV